jgi:hypothetical protein
MGAGEVLMQGSFGAAWRRAWRPAEAVLVAAGPCARHVESVEVPNRGRGGFPRQRAHQKGKNRGRAWRRGVACSREANRGEGWGQGEAGRPGGTPISGAGQPVGGNRRQGQMAVRGGALVSGQRRKKNCGWT